MMREKRFFYFSLVLHIAIFVIFTFGFISSTPMPVLENTDKNDAISAVVLGDTEKSHILPHPQNQPLPEKIQKPVPKAVTPTPKKIEAIKPIKKTIEKNQAEPIKKIPLQIIHKKTPPKTNAFKKSEKELAKSFLEDMKSVDQKQKKQIAQTSKQKFSDLLKQQTEQTMREQFKENIRLNAESSKRARGEVDRYKALILQAIRQNWLVPPSVDKEKSLSLRIRLSQNGVVLAVEMSASSGDPALDRSARAAVFKSSPLPLPENSEASNAFREFILKMSPKDIETQ